MTRHDALPRAIAAAALLAALACQDTPSTPHDSSRAAPTMPASPGALVMPAASVGDVSARMVAPLAPRETPSEAPALASAVAPDLQFIFQHPVTGSHAWWRMHASAHTGDGAYGIVPTAWSIVGVGDLTNDGIDDIYWQQTPTNALVVWTMDASDAHAGTVALSAYAPTPWKVAAVADFDRDGRADLLWRHPTTGEVVIWLMNGPTYASSVALGSVPPAWRVSTAGDLDGNGSADVFWEHTTTGQRVVWFMNGTAVTGSADLGVVPPAWTIVGIADYDGDAHNDILWVNPGTGALSGWGMIGATYVRSVLGGASDVPWVLRAVRRMGSGGGASTGPVRITVQGYSTPNAFGGLAPANLSSVRGDLTASITVDPGTVHVDSVQMRLGSRSARCLTSLRGAPIAVSCTVQTAAFNASTGAAFVPNGAQTLVFEAFYRPTSGGAQQVASLVQQPVTTANVSGVYAQVTTAPSVAQAAVNATGQTTGPQGVTWHAGAVTVRLLPVSYGSPAPAPPYTVSLHDAHGVLATRTATQDPFAPTYAATFPGATADAFDATQAPATARLDGYTSPNAGLNATGPTGALQAGTFVVLGAAPSTTGATVLDGDGHVTSLVAGGTTYTNTLGTPLFLDDQAPQPAVNFGVAGPPTTNFASTGTAWVGFVGSAFDFQATLAPRFLNTASVALSGTSTSNYDYGGVGRVATQFFAGAAASVAALTSGTPVKTGADLAPNGSNTAYNLAATFTDALGNARSQRVASGAGGGQLAIGAGGTSVSGGQPVSFGVDVAAPTLAQTSGFAQNTVTSSLAAQSFAFAGADDQGFGVNPILVTVTRTARIASTTNPVGGQPDVPSNHSYAAFWPSTYCAVAVDAHGALVFDYGYYGCQPIAVAGSVRIPAGLQGQYQITAQARDMAGNLSPAIKRTLVIDATAPFVAGLTMPAAIAGGGSATFYTSASDNLELGWVSGAVGYAGTPYALQYPDAILGTAFDAIFGASSTSIPVVVPRFVRSIATMTGTGAQSAPAAASTFTAFVTDVVYNTQSLSIVMPSGIVIGAPVPITTPNPVTNLQTFVVHTTNDASPTISAGATAGVPTTISARVEQTGPYGQFVSPFERIEIWVRTGTAPNGQALHRLVGTVLPGAVTDRAVNGDRLVATELPIAVGSPDIAAPTGGGSRTYDLLAIGVTVAGDAIVAGYTTVTVVP
ncbi:FG-GAP repeat domain-containing protein [Gemmatirosa kalamazoonensis]|nr:VCBS repeat-containing protein [Gemmatirosa kalamazoonensis]